MNTKKLKKALKLTSIVIISLFVASTASIFVILEPNVKIMGFENLDKNKLGHLNNSVSFQDENHQAITSKTLAKSSMYAAANNLNEYTINAFVSVEDKRFFDHHGIDYIRIAGATIENIKHGEYKEGGSTISQQLIKNTHLNNKKTLKRKVEEIRIARKLEREYTKEDILTMYLNSLYFGNGIYGIETAANVYFGKEASMLTLNESATLAAIINSPAIFCPYTKYENCIRRKNLVLKRMLDNKKISKEEYYSAIDEEVKLIESSDLYNQYFNNTIFEASELLNCDVWEIKNNGYEIETYFDADLSDYIENTYNETDFISKSNTEFAAIVVRNEDASVLAFYGTGRKNYMGVRRSPGSTIKPIVAYAPALESMNVSPLTPILDEKTSFEGYSPSNYLENYLGWTTVEQSLSTSSNVCAVKLLQKCGIEYSKSIAEKMGLTFSSSDRGLAIALGGMEKGVTLQELAEGYSTLAGGGWYKKSSCIKRIRDANGKTVYSDERIGMRAIREETAFLVTDMLVDCLNRGTAKHLKGLDSVAAKTGTNGNKEGNTDAYCISYSPDYTVAVWLGANSGYMPNQVSGGTIPSRINKKIMTYTKKHFTNSEFNIPKGIIELYVDRETLENEHKIEIANDLTPPIHRIKGYFDRQNMPENKSIRYFNKFLLYKDENIFFA